MIQEIEKSLKLMEEVIELQRIALQLEAMQKVRGGRECGRRGSVVASCASMQCRDPCGTSCAKNTIQGNIACSFILCQYQNVLTCRDERNYIVELCFLMSFCKQTKKI